MHIVDCDQKLFLLCLREKIKPFFFLSFPCSSLGFSCYYSLINCLPSILFFELPTLLDSDGRIRLCKPQTRPFVSPSTVDFGVSFFKEFSLCPFGLRISERWKIVFRVKKRTDWYNYSYSIEPFPSFFPSSVLLFQSLCRHVYFSIPHCLLSLCLWYKWMQGPLRQSECTKGPHKKISPAPNSNRIDYLQAPPSRQLFPLLSRWVLIFSRISNCVP